jgi:hypothetical protein
MITGGTMQTRLDRWMMILALSAVLAGTLDAHHSVRASFETTRQVPLRGTIVEVRWLNPHAEIDLAVSGADGETVTWVVEAAPPNALTRSGFDRRVLQPGDTVTIDVWLALDGSTRASGRMLAFADGRRFDIHDGWMDVYTFQK